MGLSNQEGHLVLATGNKSELAVGYSTMYGDAVGGYAPIKDLFKSEVWALPNGEMNKQIRMVTLRQFQRTQFPKSQALNFAPSRRTPTHFQII